MQILAGTTENYRTDQWKLYDKPRCRANCNLKQTSFVRSFRSISMRIRLSWVNSRSHSKLRLLIDDRRTIDWWNFTTISVKHSQTLSVLVNGSQIVVESKSLNRANDSHSANIDANLTCYNIFQAKKSTISGSMLRRLSEKRLNRFDVDFVILGNRYETESMRRANNKNCAGADRWRVNCVVSLFRGFSKRKICFNQVNN